jgi:CBS domain containing-hemolysin-like protein
VEDLRRIFSETKFSRVLVHGDNLDDVMGVASVRDLVEYDGEGTDPVGVLARPPFVVPVTKKIADLLKEFQAGRIAFAVVVDEYGGTAGIVTVEDIVEEIVGEIKDEYDLEAEPITVEHDGAVVVAGRVKVDRLEQALEAALTDGEDVSTVGGLVTSVFGRVPRPGESVEYRGFSVEVMDAERKRVNRVRFRKAEVPAP